VSETAATVGAAAVVAAARLCEAVAAPEEPADLGGLLARGAVLTAGVALGPVGLAGTDELSGTDELAGTDELTGADGLAGVDELTGADGLLGAGATVGVAVMGELDLAIVVDVVAVPQVTVDVPDELGGGSGVPFEQANVIGMTYPELLLDDVDAPEELPLDVWAKAQAGARTSRSAPANTVANAPFLMSMRETFHFSALQPLRPELERPAVADIDHARATTKSR
jgi:hypothetical protein